MNKRKNSWELFDGKYENPYTREFYEWCMEHNIHYDGTPKYAHECMAKDYMRYIDEKQCYIKDLMIIEEREAQAFWEEIEKSRRYNGLQTSRHFDGVVLENREKREERIDKADVEKSIAEEKESPEQKTMLEGCIEWEKTHCNHADAKEEIEVEVVESKEQMAVARGDASKVRLTNGRRPPLGKPMINIREFEDIMRWGVDKIDSPDLSVPDERKATSEVTAENDNATSYSSVPSLQEEGVQEQNEIDDNRVGKRVYELIHRAPKSVLSGGGAESIVDEYDYIEDNPQNRIKMSESHLKDDKTPILTAWAFIHHDKVAKLSDTALKEEWGGAIPADRADFIPKRDVPILWNYLIYTFQRIWEEGKIAETSKYAAFNTGLVDKKYEDIYALFEHNNNSGMQPWRLKDFVVAGSGAGVLLLQSFKELPQRADYFQGKLENVVLRTHCDIYPNFDHILHRVFRLPLNFLSKYCDDEMLTIDGVHVQTARAKIENWDGDQDSQRQFEDMWNRTIFERIKNSSVYHEMYERLKFTVEIAKKRIEWNYKIAIPMYYPKKRELMFLIPLTLTNNDNVDAALAVSWAEEGQRYLGRTILTLPQAYMDARLVTRPDSEWLRADAISSDMVVE